MKITGLIIFLVLPALSKGPYKMLTILPVDEAREASIAGLHDRRVTLYGGKRGHLIALYLVPEALASQTYSIIHSRLLINNFVHHLIIVRHGTSE